MSDDQPIRRRIDRVTGDDFLEGLSGRTAAEVRAMRDECRDEEIRLSYARRLLHAQQDVARAELARRGSGDSGSLVSTLGQILTYAETTGEQRSAVNAEIYYPSGEDGRRAGDRVLDGVALATLPDLDDEAIQDVVARLKADEALISALRRTVLDHLDQLQQELVRRYRDGVTSVDEILPPA